MINRIARRSICKAVAVTGAALLTMAAAATPAWADGTPVNVAEAGAAAAATTQPAATPAVRGNKLIADGVDQNGRVSLTVNKTMVITTTQPYKQLSVGSPDIADVNPIGPNNILVTAKKTGATQLIVWDDQNHSQVADIVVNMDLDSLQAELNAMLPGAKIQVGSMNGSVALKGQAPDLQTAEKAASIAAPYSAHVLNLLEVGGGQQVMLQVRFAEVSRHAINQLGVNFAMTDGIFSAGSNVGQLAPSGFDPTRLNPGALQTASGTGVTLFGSGQAGGVAFRYFLQALRQNNLLRILAEPNLVAISGQEASFLAGGEFPIPVPQSGAGGATTITIDYKEFGIRLRFVPIVLGDGRIRMKMSPEVSDLDFSSPLTIEGSKIPIVNKRTVTTTVELADGQTFAIAGLLNNTVNSSRDVTPLLGDLPILGALFRSTRYERQETELVVLVTPKLVEPMNPSQVPPLPGEEWRHPKEADLFLNADIGGEAPVKPLPGGKAIPSGASPSSTGATSGGRYRGSYGFTPPPRATTSGSNE